MQRNQLKAVTKDELIDSILSSQEEEGLVTVTSKLDILVNEVAAIKKACKDSIYDKKITELQSQVDKQADIIAKQQRFLESIDRKERECNLVITGVPDAHESVEGATSDNEKIAKIWEKVSVTTEVRDIRRLGRINNNESNNSGNTGDGSRLRRRPLLVTVANRYERDRILENANKFKASGEMYSRIYIKKDVHPSIREEWKRLRDAEKTEKERPENVGCNIYLNVRERQLYKDGEVIDKWNWMGF